MAGPYKKRQTPDHVRIEAEIRVELQEPRDPEERLGCQELEAARREPPSPHPPGPGREFVATTFAVIYYGGPNPERLGTDAFEK